MEQLQITNRPAPRDNRTADQRVRDNKRVIETQSPYQKVEPVVEKIDPTKRYSKHSKITSYIPLWVVIPFPFINMLYNSDVYADKLTKRMNDAEMNAFLKEVSYYQIGDQLFKDAFWKIINTRSINIVDKEKVIFNPCYVKFQFYCPAYDSPKSYIEKFKLLLSRELKTQSQNEQHKLCQETLFDINEPDNELIENWYLNTCKRKSTNKSKR